MINIVYKRILIINDDNKEEDFFRKYEGLQSHKDIIQYCNSPNQAFSLITQENFSGFDKIILDIKIDWDIPEAYREKIAEYINIDAMQQINMGFVIFMYLISKGFPIRRIAFLSAYIKEQDSEYSAKFEMKEMLKDWKVRTELQDRQVVEFAEKVPSLKGRIIQILDDKKYKGVGAYKRIKDIIEDDIATNSEKLQLNNVEVMNNEHFFELLERTGIKVAEKISKRDVSKLEKWIFTEENEQLKLFYDLRFEILNICESVKQSDPYIYDLYKKNNSDFKKNYPKNYFENLMSKIQYEISVFGEGKNIEMIIERVINSMVAFWESLSSIYMELSPSEENINNHAITMVLKSTRNWCAHGRIKALDIPFCEFIFLLSIKVIYGKNQDVEEYICQLHDSAGTVKFDWKAKSREIWKNINDAVVGQKTLKTNTYTLNLVDLYYKYSNDKARKAIDLKTIDLMNMFILCLHYPFIHDVGNGKFEIGFYEIESIKQEKLMVILEKIAVDYVSNRK